MFYLMKWKYAIFSHFKVTKIELSAFWGDTWYSILMCVCDRGGGGGICHGVFVQSKLMKCQKDFVVNSLLDSSSTTVVVIIDKE